MERHSQILGVMIVALFVLSQVLPLPSHSVAASLNDEELQYYTDYISYNLDQKGIVITPEQAEGIVRQAYSIAVALFGDNAAQCTYYQEKLLQDYVQVAGEDVIIIYNPGGMGRASIKYDPQWGEVAGHMKTMLEEKGYSAAILDYKRTANGIIQGMMELKDFVNAYPVKSEWLSTEIKFLLQNTPSTKIILTGVSQGAAYINEVMKRLEGEPLAAQRVVCVEAGVPFYYKAGIASGQILELCDNGMGEDSLVTGDMGSLISTYVLAPLKWCVSYLKGIPVDPIDCCHNPGHDYYWVYPGVEYPITAFLEQHFN